MATEQPSSNRSESGEPMKREPIVGIDLGTTNSLVAIAGWQEAGAPARVIPDAQGRALCPSAVRFSTTEPPVVGYDARDRAIEFPMQTVVSAKRLMGRSLRDAQADVPYLSYRVVEGPNETARIELPFVPFADRRVSVRDEARGSEGDERSRSLISPQEVGAIVLRALKEQASDALGVDVKKAVVTVPAYFDDAQRQATRDAARLAGLEAVRIVAEPTAAALAYGLGVKSAGRERIIVVYDLGGGTFDVSVLRITPGGADGADAFQVLATTGDTHLGGDDFDYALVAMLTREISGRFFGGAEIAASLDPSVRRALRDFAERTKIALSERENASVRIDLGADERGAARVYERVVTRGEFESLIAPMVDRTIAACRRALRDARREIGDARIDAAVMVGGSTRVPLVRRRVGEALGVEPYVALDPDQVVALGAAVQASILSGASRDALLLDVVPLSLGIETAGGAFAKIIMRNATIPAQGHEMFSTQADNQTGVKLHVLQGEREMAEHCRSLGEFHLRGIPPMPAGIPQVRVEFRVDANGVLSVAAHERRSGKRLDVQIIPHHGLSRQEVDRIERESFSHAHEDMTRHRVADLVANSTLDLTWIERQLARVGGAFGGEARLRLDETMQRVRALLAAASATDGWKSVDADAFQAAKEAMDRASMPLHELGITMSLREEGMGGRN